MADLAVLVPRQALISDLETRLVNKPRVKNTLITFVRLTEEALASAPKMELPQPEKSVSASEVTRHILTAIAAMRRLLMLEQWRSDNVRAWQVWWKQVAGAAEDAPLQAKASENVLGKETLTGHLARLSDAIGEAQPYRAAADALGRAWISGRETHRYQRAQNLREAITRQLAPLKLLGGLAEAQARLAIETLSEEIGSILERMHRSGGLAFKGANLQRRAGLQVRGGFANGFKIDATLVANTSWLRAVLWAFLFALRNEAVKQMGSDPLPLLVLDDPQATFDAEHRNRWANEIIGLQAAQIPVQVLLTTYDETFVDLVKIEGVGGREAIIVSAGPELGRVGIFEGASIDRQWAKTQAENTPAAGQVYIADVRVYVEGLLRLMLSGHTAGVNSATKGLVMRTLRDKICELNNAKLAPWDKSEFKRLASQLEGGIPAIKQMEMAHHSGRGNLGMSEARGVEEHWRKHLSPALQRAFHLARDYQLIHGGLRALHATDPNCALPEGYTDVIRNLRLRRVGRAAAFTGGRIADGRVDLNFNSIDQNTLVLGGHFALRLNAPTLEPVARIGDILLIREVDQPSPNSLVVARYEGKVIARRFEIAENHSDIVVLTAHAISPYQIAQPIVVKKSTLQLHKIVGVLFNSGHSLTSGEGEVDDCGGESVLRRYASDVKELVEVDGHSAEPIALQGQMLMIGDPMSAADAIEHLEGRPVIAGDADDRRYFKRLRRGEVNSVVLESLETSGDFPPVILTHNTGQTTDLKEVWPIYGVLFEQPYNAH